VPTTNRIRLGPLYLAGFTTAFGAHGIAAALGVETEDLGLSLLGFGLVLALYDIAEVILKPVFGALSDRMASSPSSSVGAVSTAALGIGVVAVGVGASAAVAATTLRSPVRDEGA
jgi:MFS family permease